MGKQEIDLKKIIESIKIPTLVSIIVGILTPIISFLNSNISLGGGIGLTSVILLLLMPVYSGFLASKKVKEMDALVQSGIAGSLTMSLGTLLAGVISLLIVYSDVWKSFTSWGTGTNGPELAIVNLVLTTIITLVIGFILGVIGFFIGRGIMVSVENQPNLQKKTKLG